MKERHFGRDSLVGVQSRHALEQIHFQLIETWGMLLHWNAPELRERWLEVL